MMFKKTTKLAAWLQSRDWFVEREINREIEKFEQEVEQSRIYATAKLIVKFQTLRDSAKHEMNNGESAKYRRQATTEFKKITEEIKRLHATIPEGKSPLGYLWETE